MPNSRLVFVGIKGTAIGLDQESGVTVWETHLKGTEFVHIVLDGDYLYAITFGEVFCLEAATGTLRWQNHLRGYGFGLGSIAIQSIPTIIDVSPVVREANRRAESPPEIHDLPRD